MPLPTFSQDLLRQLATSSSPRPSTSVTPYAAEPYYRARPSPEHFDEFAARSEIEEEVASETYRSIGRPYGCTEDCSGHEAGFKYRARHGTWGALAGGYEDRSFRQGQKAFDDEVERRVEDARQEHERQSFDEEY